MSRIKRALPEAPFEPSDKRTATVSSNALVRNSMNDYSAPPAYGFRDVQIKGFVDEVAIISGASEIARHLCAMVVASSSSINRRKRTRPHE